MAPSHLQRGDRGRQPGDRGGRRQPFRAARRPTSSWPSRPPSGRSPEWSRTDVEKRAHILAEAAALIEERAKEIAARADLRAGQADRRGARRGHAPRPRRALLRRGRDQGPRRLPGAALGVRPRLRPGDPPARWASAPRSPRTTSRSRCWAPRSRRRWRPATPWSPSPPPRRRWRRSRSRGSSPRPGSRTACSTSSPAAARRSATRSSATPTSAGSRSPARPRSAAT